MFHHKRLYRITIFYLYSGFIFWSANAAAMLPVRSNVPASLTIEHLIENVWHEKLCVYHCCKLYSSAHCPRTAMLDLNTKECKIGTLSGTPPLGVTSGSGVFMAVGQEPLPEIVPHIFILGIPNPVDFSLVPDASPPMDPLLTSVNGMSGTGFFYYRGGILTCGGKLNNAGSPYSTCHFHSMSGLDSEPIPDLPAARWASGNVMMDGNKPWMLGGSTNAIDMLDSSVYLDDDGTWKTGATLPLRLGWPCAVNIDDSTYFLGGGATQNSPILIDMSAYTCSGNCDTWVSAGSIPGPERFLLSCAKASLDDGRVVVAMAGGKDLALSSDVKMYDVSSGNWFSGPSLPGVRARGGMITLPASGRVLYVGGTDTATDNPQDEIFELNLDLSGWTQLEERLPSGVSRVYDNVIVYPN